MAARSRAFRRARSRHGFDPGPNFSPPARSRRRRSGLQPSNLQPAFGLVQGDDAAADPLFSETRRRRGAKARPPSAASRLQNIRSVAGFERRLNDMTCAGCHQTRGIGGFHFPGVDWMAAEARQFHRRAGVAAFLRRSGPAPRYPDRVARRPARRIIRAASPAARNSAAAPNSPAPNMRTAGARIAIGSNARCQADNDGSFTRGPAPRGWPASPSGPGLADGDVLLSKLARTAKSAASDAGAQIDSRLTNRVSSPANRSKKRAGRKHGRHHHRRRRHRRPDPWAWRCTRPEFPAGSSNRPPKSGRSASASICCRMPPRNSRRSGSKPALAKIAIATKDATFFNRFGQLIYQEPLGRAAGYDHPQFSIHRGDLQMAAARRLRRPRRRRPVRHQPSLHRRRTGRDRRQRAFFRRARRRQSQHRARPGRDRLRRHQFRDPQAVFPGRGRAALFRHQHVARRDAMEADAVRRQHGAGGLAVARQDGDLSDPRRRRRRPATHQLGRRDRNAGVPQARLEPAGLARRFHRRVRRLAFRLARCAGLDPCRRQRAGISDGRSGPVAALELWPGDACSATPRTRWCRAAPTAPARRSSMRGR